jgi:DNA-binding beta-propeller fold protein YncE
MWLVGSVSMLVLLLMFVLVGAQVVGNPKILPLSLVKNVSLPSAVPAQFLPDIKTIPIHEDPLAPGVAVRFDHFDFQVLDPVTGLLFIAHTGPNPLKMHDQVNTKFQADKDIGVDGQVLVVDTKTNTLVNRVNVPQVTGVAVAPDIGKVYVSDNAESKIVVIDEKSLKTTEIQLANLEAPDAIGYDPLNHKIFVSNSGAVAANANNVSPDNQSLLAIDVGTNRVVRINLGKLGLLPGEHPELRKFGYSVGHNKYDAVLRREFVVIQQMNDQSGAQPVPVPPAGTGELVAIDPTTNRVIQGGRVQLPKRCGMPHGFNIDEEQQIGYIACTAIDPGQNLVPNLVRVDLRSMQVIADALLPLGVKPDIVVVDRAAHTVFVGSGGAVSIFTVQGRSITSRGGFVVGKGTHTLVVDERTQLVYLPLAEEGGRPILRIERYNPSAFA